MQKDESHVSFSHMSEFLARAFPLPKLLYPRSAGIDISDSSIKWIVLGTSPGESRILSWGEESLPEGIVVGGVVQSVPDLAAALARIQKKIKVSAAHTALPEESAYVFSMLVPEGATRQTILNMIEFELEGRVPISPKDAVYDYDFITETGEEQEEIGVVVFPKKFAEGYVAAFDSAGLTLLSLEIEARSAARAVSSPEYANSVTLLVDFGRMRTGFAVLKHGVPIFTSTVPVGGTKATLALAEKMKFSFEEAEQFKNESGLFAAKDERSPASEVLLGMAAALADEIAHHFHYWDTRRNEKGDRVSPVESILLVGGSANLKGLPSYIAGRVQATTERPNVWRNVCSFNGYIPPIDRRISLQYATAIGLALRGV